MNQVVKGFAAGMLGVALALPVWAQGVSARDPASSSAGAPSSDAESDRSSARQSKRSAKRNKSKANSASGTSGAAGATTTSGAGSPNATGCDKLSGRTREDCMERLRSGDSAKLDASAARSSPAR